jgi:CMP-N,N'-diacetyllegionaminic acid synthase
MKSNILAIIPARGGSKGIHKKNLAELGGKCLIDYSISLGADLIDSGLISRCIVSSDDAEIIEHSSKKGADVPFVRPSRISNDESKSIDYIIHALENLDQKKNIYDSVLILQPTSPFRTLNHTIDAIKIFNEKNSQCLISCYREDYINDTVIYHKNKIGYAVPLSSRHSIGVRRQDHESIYIRNGAIYLTKTKFIYDNKRIINNSPFLFEMKKFDSLNIDTLEDLEIARFLLKSI